jgi:hypothetical protein
VPTYRSLEKITAEDFRSVLSSRFRLVGRPRQDGSQAVFEAELTEVTEHSTGAPDSRRAPFSVLFQGPGEPVMQQDTYRLEHERFGILEVFIVPVGPAGTDEAASAMRYEAVFS